MPEGSSSEAPVMRPGPSARRYWRQSGPAVAPFSPTVRRETWWRFESLIDAILAPRGFQSFAPPRDDPLALATEPWDPANEARRRYVTRLARQRLHQAAFRERVLVAYRRSCCMCGLRHDELLESAHILPDTHPRGLQV